MAGRPRVWPITRKPLDIVAVDRKRLRNAPLTHGSYEDVVLPLDPKPVEPGLYEWPLLSGALLRIELNPDSELPDVDPDSFELYFWISSSRFGDFLDNAALPEEPRITKYLTRSGKTPRETAHLFLGQVSARLRDGRYLLDSFADADGTLRETTFDAQATLAGLIGTPEPEALFDTLLLGYWAQTLAALDALWTFVFLGLDASLSSREIAHRAADPRYGRTTGRWRTTGPLTEVHVDALARAWRPAELPR